MAQQYSVPLQGGVPPAGADRFAGAPGPGFGPGPRGGLMFLPPWLMAILAVGTFLAFAVAFYLVFRKAGYPGLLGLLMAVPGVNIAVAFFLALAEWPVLRELREQRAIVAMHAAESHAVPGTEVSAAPVPEAAVEPTA